MPPTADPVDLIEELRLRRWARENYCYSEARQESWHPIVHEEMQLRDTEGLSDCDVMLLAEDDLHSSSADTAIDVTDTPASEFPLLIGPIVPLAPSLPTLHGPHEITPPHKRVSEPSERTELHIG